MTLTQIKPAGLSKPVDLADNEKIRLGTGNDLEIYHNGSNTYLDNNTGNLYFRGSDGQMLFRPNNTEDALVLKPNGAVELYHNNVKRLETTHNSVNVTGNLNVSQSITITSLLNCNGDVNFNGDNYNIIFDKSDSTIEFKDNAKCRFGDGNDLQIYHDGTNSYIKNATGRLRFNSDIYGYGFYKGDSELLAKFDLDGAVELYYDNSKKFETISAGAAISGNLGVGATTAPTHHYNQGIHVHATGAGATLHLTDNTTGSGASDGFDVVTTGGEAFLWQRENSNMRFGTNATERMRIDSSGRVQVAGTLGYGNIPLSGNPANAAIHIRTDNKYKGIALGEGAISGAIGMGGDETSTAMVFTANAHPANLGGGTHDTFEWWSGSSGGGGPGKNMTLNTQGHLQLVSGNLELSSGAGIDFSAVSDGSRSVSTDGNKFDDYEEGTYTVTTSLSGITITNNTTARYIKIGRLVYVQMDVSVGSNSDGNTSRFSLPFSSAIAYGSGIAGWSSLGRPIMFHISGSQAFAMDNSTSGNTSQHLTMSELSGNRFIANFFFIH